MARAQHPMGKEDLVYGVSVVGTAGGTSVLSDAAMPVSVALWAFLPPTLCTVTKQRLPVLTWWMSLVPRGALKTEPGFGDLDLCWTSPERPVGMAESLRCRQSDHCGVWTTLEHLLTALLRWGFLLLFPGMMKALRVWIVPFLMDLRTNDLHR